MPLFLNKINSGPASVDLFSITRCDGGLGQQNRNSQVDLVVYTKSSSGAGQDRIEALVNGAANIAITAMPSGATVPDGMGGNVPINLVGGATFPADTALPADEQIIQVAYCFNNQMFAFDTNGNPISLPSQVLLFHELSHAFHHGNGTFNAANPEAQAITDENTFRAQVNLAARDPNNHNGGEGPGDGRTIASCAGGSTGISPCCKC